ncbi:hypothetical protein K525DRAFT_204290, partial [Schizophyllum commune Loenen D]
QLPRAHRGPLLDYVMGHWTPHRRLDPPRSSFRRVVNSASSRAYSLEVRSLTPSQPSHRRQILLVHVRGPPGKQANSAKPPLQTMLTEYKMSCRQMPSQRPASPAPPVRLALCLWRREACRRHTES